MEEVVKIMHSRTPSQTKKNMGLHTQQEHGITLTQFSTLEKNTSAHTNHQSLKLLSWDFSFRKNIRLTGTKQSLPCTSILILNQLRRDPF